MPNAPVPLQISITLELGILILYLLDSKIEKSDSFNLKNLPSGELEEVKNKVLNDQLGLSKPKNLKQNKNRK